MSYLYKGSDKDQVNHPQNRLKVQCILTLDKDVQAVYQKNLRDNHCTD